MISVLCNFFHKAQCLYTGLQYFVPCLPGSPSSKSLSMLNAWHFFTQLSISYMANPVQSSPLHITLLFLQYPSTLIIHVHWHCTSIRVYWLHSPLLCNITVCTRLSLWVTVGNGGEHFLIFSILFLFKQLHFSYIHCQEYPLLLKILWGALGNQFSECCYRSCVSSTYKH